MTTSSSDSQLAARASYSAGAGGCPASATERETWRAVGAALPSIGALQRAALSIYGRLEPDRALVWTMEELGELAQAVRRNEGRARLEEELGQLTAWMLCLANILNVDLATAVESAIREEIERQLAKPNLRLVPSVDLWFDLRIYAELRVLVLAT
jgi:NTP pyrophosphatase (non-canonical NTP hydrolase)